MAITTSTDGISFPLSFHGVREIRVGPAKRLTGGRWPSYRAHRTITLVAENGDEVEIAAFSRTSELPLVVEGPNVRSKYMIEMAEEAWREALIAEGFERVSDRPKLRLECWNTKKPWDQIPNIRMTCWPWGWRMSAVNGYRTVLVSTPRGTGRHQRKRETGVRPPEISANGSKRRGPERFDPPRRF